MKIAILKNEEENSALKWQKACEKYQLYYDIIDLVANDWFDKVTETKYDLFLLKPGGKVEKYKQLYDERIYIINKVLNKKIFPSYEEAYIYENKKLLSYYLRAKNIPHPLTYVIYNRNEAIDLLKTLSYPIVAKSSIGASGSGVKVIRDQNSGTTYIKKAFSSKGIKRRFGPNRTIGNPNKWIRKALKSPKYLTNRLREYLNIYQDGQRGYVILQEYIDHDFEWRAVKIGSSYFAHKKIVQNGKASGSKGIEYTTPPLKLLDFIRKLCMDNNFNSVAIDIFEHPERGYLVNEIQTIFGHVQSHILEVNGKPGRYLYQNNQWLFEEGDFNTNESYDLRLQVALELNSIGEL